MLAILHPQSSIFAFPINWLQIVPGKGWNTIFRINGALQSWFDKTWKLGEIEPVKGS